MYLMRLALQSLANRRFSALLTVIAIALSVTLLLSVERVRTEARASFASTVSGTDLIVGARSGSVQLLLYSVFRIGNATNNIRWDSFEQISHQPQVKWAIPLSLGDSHRGFRVLGTNQAYLEDGRPTTNLHLPLQNEASLGQLFQMLMLATVVEGRLIGINPYGQPGVESYKRNMNALLREDRTI